VLHHGQAEAPDPEREAHWPAQTTQSHTLPNGVAQLASVQDTTVRPPAVPTPAHVVAPPQTDASAATAPVHQYPQPVVVVVRPPVPSDSAAHVPVHAAVSAAAPAAAAAVNTGASAPRPEEAQVPSHVPRTVPTVSRDAPVAVARPSARQPDSGRQPTEGAVPLRDSSVDAPAAAPVAVGTP
jgi:hypothetical protein